MSVVEGDTGTVAATFTVSPLAGQRALGDGRLRDGRTAPPLRQATTRPRAGPLTFTPGQTTKTVTVLVNGDTLDELDETYFVDLSNASNANIGDSHGVGTIIDDDAQPTLSINNVTVTEGDTGMVNANFTVSLSSASGQTVSVGYSTADGTATAARRLHRGRRQPRLHARPGDEDGDGSGQGRHTGRGRRDLHGQPRGCGQCGDRRRHRGRDDHRRRSATHGLGRQRDGHRGRHGHRRRQLHGQPERGQRQDDHDRLRDRGRHRHRLRPTTPPPPARSRLRRARPRRR